MKCWIAIAAGALLLAACGGGDGDVGMAPPVNKAPGTDVPVSATQDPNAAYEFVASLAASSSETADPLVVGDAMLATTDTDEPKPL